MLLTKIARLTDYLLLTLGLLSALPLPFEQVVQASENATALSSPYMHHLLGKNKRLPATLTAWKEVDLVYARLFPYDRARQPHPPAGCVVLPAISTRSDRQGPGIKTTPAVLMLRCREHIDLLRPAQWVSNREQQQYRQGYLLVSMPEMGITDVRVHIAAVKSSLFNSAILSMKHALSRPVIGVFIRHTTNVKQYTFKDTLTGKIERIKATPNHPFYVVNQQRYLPVSQLSTHDQMVNVLGHSVAIVCSAGKSSHCGQPYHPGQVITVYNLEVYGQHRYFVGKPGVMVHNGYKCPHCSSEFDSEAALNMHVAEHAYADKRPLQKPLQRSLKCEECDRIFDRLADFTKHLKTTHAEKTFKCTLCDMSYGSEWQLKLHLRSRLHKDTVKLGGYHALDSTADVSSVASDSFESSGQMRARSRSPIHTSILEEDDPPWLAVQKSLRFLQKLEDPTDL